MTKRFINNIHNLEFKPFDNYGEPVKGMSWHKISYDKQNGGFGTYILKMDPGAKSLSHVHQGFEEFYVIDGELIDADGKILLHNFYFLTMCHFSSIQQQYLVDPNKDLSLYQYFLNPLFQLF